MPKCPTDLFGQYQRAGKFSRPQQWGGSFVCLRDTNPLRRSFKCDPRVAFDTTPRWVRSEGKEKRGGGRQVAASGIGIISKRGDNRNASAVTTSLSHIVVNDQYHSLLSAVGHVWGAAWSRGRDRRTFSRSCLRGGWGQNRLRWLCANPPRQIFIKFLLREFLVKFCEVETA